MYPNQLYPILQRHLRDDKLRRKSIFLEGASGIGKSEMVHKLAYDEGVEIRDKRLSQMDAVDLGGTPWKSERGFTQWAPPDWLEFDPASHGILLMDEVTSASREVFAASYQLFLDHQINGARVPDGWLTVAAGNRVSDRGVINVMPSPLLNRFIKITVEPHLDSWRDWAAAHDVDPRLISWISHQTQYLHNFTPEIAAANESFSTPRSIVSAGNYLDWQDGARVEMLRGCIGKEAAASLESHIRLHHKLPSFDQVMADPVHCRIPKDEDLGEKYAMAMMCSSKMDRSTYEKLWRYVDRLGAQFVVLATRLAMQRDMSISTARGYKDFTEKHQAVFAR